MSGIRNTILSATKQLKRSFKKRPVSREYFHEGVPYFSQWESPELVEAIVTKEMSARDDPKWKASGAESKEEYNAWGASGCGMACTKMLVAELQGIEVPLVELGKKCAEYGGYSLPVEESIGLVYAPFVTFAGKELGLMARVVLPLLLTEIIEELSDGNYVIASVSPQIRNVTAKPKNKGGHLVLLLGYDLDKRLLFFHNPSGFVKQTQEYASISFADFKKFFGGRGIVVKGHKARI